MAEVENQTGLLESHCSLLSNNIKVFLLLCMPELTAKSSHVFKTILFILILKEKQKHMRHFFLFANLY